MEANSWATPLSYVSKRYQPALQTRSEMLMGFEEIEVDDDTRDEYPCPFCSEYFDIVGLCCHIDDEHPVEAGNGVCPVCAMRVGIDMVAHITLQHRNIFKVQPKRKSRKLGSHSTLYLLRKELREGNLRSIFGGSSCVVPPSNAAPDPLLSSFIIPTVDDYYEDVQSAELFKKSTNGTNDMISDRKAQQPPMSLEDQEEKTKRCDFVRELLWSTILDDNL